MLPITALKRTPQRGLPRQLRRALAAATAVRSADEALALHVLAERVADEPSLRVAEWLAGRGDLAPPTRLAVAGALLDGGAWRRAEEVLLAVAAPPEPRLAFRSAYVRGRVAYRLGELERAGEAFDQALETASSDDERFAAAVQRARVAELCADTTAALGLWDIARSARPREVEGWDGSSRVRVALGRGGDAVGLLAHCPGPVLRIVGPRLAATLLLHRDAARARAVLGRLPSGLPAVRALVVACAVQEGRIEGARERAEALLADQRSGPWREQVLQLLPPSADGGTPPPPSRDPAVLARVATRSGAPAARRSLEAALAQDPEWRGALAAGDAEPNGWEGPAAALAAVGLEREAAAIYAYAFPSATLRDLAWSARALAAWGNQPAALAVGERLWADLGGVPASLLPDAVLPVIVPPSLSAGCVAAAKRSQLPPSWLVAIVRQESRFDTNAYSRAGAVGIAQLVPETALRLGASPVELYDRESSLLLAARELARLRVEFGGRLAPVAASYNAGEAVVRTWLAELGEDPNDVLFTAALPYHETVQYTLAVVEGASLARYLK